MPSAPFLCTEIDLCGAGRDVVTPAGSYGIGVLIRQKDDPVGYCLKSLAPSSRVTPDDVVRWAAEGHSPVVPPEEHQGETGAGFPSLSIAVCTRNRPNLVARCLHSLLELNSASAGIEVLVVDNAPGDERTQAAVQQMAGALYFREPVPGLDFARNRAVSEASGHLLAFIDDDAVVDRRWLSGLRRAWTANSDAGAFTGPIVPWELRTPAQVVFEMRGGFGRSFQPVRYGQTLGDDPVYPCHAGIFGSGCNMVFRRDLLRELGGFDEALDTGPPLPASGDIDMFFRVVISGNPLVYAPQMVVYHEHRHDYAGLRHQMWTWGLGLMAFVQKHQRLGAFDPERFRRLIQLWFSQKADELKTAVLRPERSTGGAGLVAAELLGGAFGLTGAYERSVRRVRDRKRRYAGAA